MYLNLNLSFCLAVNSNKQKEFVVTVIYIFICCVCVCLCPDSRRVVHVLPYSEHRAAVQILPIQSFLEQNVLSIFISLSARCFLWHVEI